MPYIMEFLSVNEILTSLHERGKERGENQAKTDEEIFEETNKKWRLLQQFVLFFICELFFFVFPLGQIY